MGGNIPGRNFPGRGLIGGNLPGGRFPDTVKEYPHNFVIVIKAGKYFMSNG